MKIGEINSLIVSRESPHGMYLIDENKEEVLLPGKYLKGDEKKGDMLEVFIYNDSEDRIIATTERPKIRLNEFAALKAVDVTRLGVFLDWGLEKDLFVPFREQNKKMIAGHTYVVRMFLDEETDRLAATSRIKRYLSNNPLTVKEKEQVNLLVFNQGELGYEVIINGVHSGMIFRNEIFSSITVGDSLTGYIKKIREDGKIDVSLQPERAIHLDESCATIMKLLNEHGGKLNLSDKSSPQEIYEKLHMSKKVFKKAIGNLYKNRKITIGSHEISRVK